MLSQHHQPLIGSVNGAFALMLQTEFLIQLSSA